MVGSSKSRPFDPTRSCANVGYLRNKDLSSEIGAGNARMQGKSAAGGNNWIPAVGVSGGVFDAEGARMHQQVQRLLHSICGTSGHQAQVAGGEWPLGPGTRCGPVLVSRWEEAGDG